MEFPLLNLLKAIRSELGPVLHELGVRPKFEAKNPGVRVKFVAPDGSFSPVQLELTHRAIAGGAFGGSWMVLSGFTPVKIGQSGWLAHRHDSGQGIVHFPESGDEAFDQIRNALTSRLVVQLGKRKPYYISNFYLAEVYQEVEAVLGPKYRFTCSRSDDGVESFQFVDRLGREWRIAFERYMANIYVNDQLVTAIQEDDFLTIGEYVSANEDEPDLVASRKPII